MRDEGYFSFPVEVDRSDFYLLEKMRAAGARITLRLDPANGGLEASLAQKGLEWPFVSEIDSSFNQEFEDSRVAVEALLGNAPSGSDDPRPRAERPPEYTHYPLQEYAEQLGEGRRHFFTLDLQRGQDGLEFFSTLAEAQAEVVRIAHRDGVEGHPEDVLRWMGKHADVFWGKLMG
jgi:hypothetical protein